MVAVKAAATVVEATEEEATGGETAAVARAAGAMAEAVSELAA